MKHLFTTILLFLSLQFSFGDVRLPITHWTFDGTTEPIIGEGVASLIGGTEQHSVESTAGWRFIAFPAQHEASGTAGAQFMISTEGYENIKLDFEHRSSGTASRWAQFEYTIDGGISWEVYGNNSGGLFPRDEFYPFSMDFSGIEAVNNNPEFGVRIVSIFSPQSFNPGEPDEEFDANTAYQRARDDGGSEYTPDGNWRIREVVFSGEMITPDNFYTFTRWTFDGTTEPLTGEGVASLVGETQEHSADMEDGWRFFNFPVQGNGSGTAGASFMVSTEGYENIHLNFEQRASGTASRWAQFEYTTDGGTTWEIYGNNNAGLNPRDVFHPFSMDLSEIPAANNNPEFGVRIVSIFSLESFNPGVPDILFAANTTYHRARDFDDGGGEYSHEGNWRLRNVSFSGELILYENPTKLKIENVDEQVYVGLPFSVTVGIYNADDQPAAAENDTEITLELLSGNGTLTGNITGTINEGSQKITIAGILYDTAEQIEIRANAPNLDASAGQLMEVTRYLWTLVLNNNMPGAGSVTGTGEFIAGTEVVVEATPMYGFNFVKWVDDNDNELSIDAHYTFSMPGNDLELTAIFSPDTGEDLIHYWHFNDLPGGILETVNSDFSAFVAGNITYPGSGDGYMDNFDTGSGYNLHLGALSGLGLRLRNPAISREMIIESPSAGFTNLHLTFEAHRSNNGPTQQDLYYSVDNGTTWVPIDLGYEIYTDYHIYSFPLTAFPETENNPNLQLRLTFTGENNTGTAGNNRFDNILLSGNLIDGYTSSNQHELRPEKGVYPNPASDHVYVNVLNENSIITISSLSGQEVISQVFTKGQHQIDLRGITPGFYLLQIQNTIDSKTVTHKILIK